MPGALNWVFDFCNIPPLWNINYLGLNFRGFLPPNSGSRCGEIFHQGRVE